MENLKLAGFRDQIFQIVSNNGLPVGVSLYVLKDIVTEIEKLYQETTEKEYREYLAEQQRKAKEEEEKEEQESEQDNQD